MNFYTKTVAETIEYLQKIHIDTRKTNTIKEKKRKSLISRFFSQFSDFMTMILLIASVISFVIALMSDNGEFLDPVIILVIVVFNAILGVIEEAKADKAINSLKKLTSPTATVIRNNKEMTIPAENVQIGDILVLTTGCRISADARLLEDTALETDESALTGESMSSEKNSNIILPEYTPLAEQKNMVFSSTNVVHGKGKAIVTAIGMDTEMGKIAALLSSAEDEPTPLQRKMSETGKTLGVSAIIVCALVFLLGILKQVPPLEMFLTSVSLAVAAIPEGLPIIATIVLAVGVRRMARRNAIVKNLPAVETLGSATVICTDKTGTLTENKMCVKEIIADDEKELLKISVLCCDSTNNPTENAIITYAEQIGIKKKQLDSIHNRVSENPFDSERKLMSVIVEYPDTNKQITKGAPEVLLRLCKYIEKSGKILPLIPSERRRIQKSIENMSDDALRVIGIACKNVPSDIISEDDLIFCGIIGMSDPPRAEAAPAVAECINAGIKPVMITGDNKITATSIAKEVGITGKAITGSEMKKLTDNDLTEYSIFARVTPADKVRIVKSFKNKGEIVAMTGDGVNDAPALKNADIGCGMGKNGTDVAKEASDLILADDNFATIVAAVKEGRGIFENIKKAVKFLLSSNIGEILTVFVGMLLSWDSPLCATQLLWVNLITDSLPALSLGVDPVDKNIMKKAPQDPKDGIFTGSAWTSIILEGCLIGMLSIIAYILGMFQSRGDIAVARTMAFCVLALSQLFHAFNMRSDKSVLNSKFFMNKYLILSLVLGIILQVCVVNIPVLCEIFKTSRLNTFEWQTTFGLSIMPLVIVEIQKLFSR